MIPRPHLAQHLDNLFTHLFPISSLESPSIGILSSLGGGGGGGFWFKVVA